MKKQKVFTCVVTGQNWNGPLVFLGKTKKAVDHALTEWVLDQEWEDGHEPPLKDPIKAYFSSVGEDNGEFLDVYEYVTLL